MSARTTQPTVDELNEIQRAWMDLSAFDSEAEKNRVFRLMERYPSTYVSGHDGLGVVVLDGMPMSTPVEFETALSQCREHGGRVDVAWNGTLGEWYPVKG